MPPSCVERLDAESGGRESLEQGSTVGVIRVEGFRDIGGHCERFVVVL
jgi:hypothetical protein